MTNQFPAERKSTALSNSSDPASEAKRSRGPLLVFSNFLLIVFIAGIGLAATWDFLIGTLLVILSLIAFLFTRLALKGTENAVAPETNQSMRDLKQELYQAQYLDHVEIEGQKLYQQYEDTQTRYRNYLATLNSKFDKTEVTYGRYHAVGEQAYLAILENCSRALPILKQMSQLDFQAAHLQQLKLSNEPTSAETISELQHAKERVELYAQTKKKFSETMDLNQQALSGLDQLTAKLNEIKTQEGLASAELDTIMGELKLLADRAHLYSKK